MAALGIRRLVIGLVRAAARVGRASSPRRIVSRMNGYNFTERVRKILAMAREEAVRLHHEYVGTEHILLGLILEGEGVAAAVLQSLNVDLEEIQQKIEETVKKGKAQQGTGPDLPYTSRAKKVLELAMSEARELNHSYVGTEHILLGLIREEKGIAAVVLSDVGIELPVARAEVLRLLGTDVAQHAPPGPQRGSGEPTREKTSKRTQSDSHPLEKTLTSVYLERAASQRRPASERRLWAKTAAAFEDSAGTQDPIRAPKDLQSLPPAEWATDRARAVIGRARAEAATRRSRHIDPEHLLIALLQEEGGMASTVLDHLAIDLPALQRAAAGAIEETLASDEPYDLDVSYSPLAESALRHAFHETRVARERRVGTDHLLLGLLLETSAPASRVLTDAGLRDDSVRDERSRIAG
jgi:ATP-dependent Clp protease ATP-binding subunit ClpA